MLNFLKKLFGSGSPANLSELLTQDALVLDVRTREEFNSGHPEGAQNVPLQELDLHLSKLKALSRPVITCCVSGRRSGNAAQKLKAAGVQAINGGPWQDVAEAIAQSKKLAKNK
jgi:rhodanese-related sulfurtransferase